MTKEILGSLELNRIYQMDCLEGMKLIPDRSIDMILCDLPYGTTRNNWDVVIDLNKLWTQYERIIKDSGAIVLTAQTPFDKILGSSNLKLLKYEWIWVKKRPTGHLNSKKMPMKAHENILVFYKKTPVYNPQGLIKKDIPTVRKGRRGNGQNYGKSDKDAIQKFENYPKDILQFPQDSKGIHPTQKPVALFEYLIKTYTNENDVVLDNCMGSGTTAVSATLNNRKWLGFETDKEYIKLANERLEHINLELDLINLS
ncbi:site-specific DNA-methyltransferase [Bacillus velezensis]|uniref:DNA-methyltransferase n=1 Tax=Bacillus velezensis TaxID=492670 RepID=UPI002DBF3822|nr:site-specific DNA-methyltransferase [Bacillus velezensis]MEC1393657.1 site-specific DNA-methyltransferase [Bacillus velezensis]